jgi:uncharacterized protein (DUF4415 family)
MQMSARHIVKFKLDPENPPRATAAQKRRLAAVAVMPDSKIDYSDIPRQSVPVEWTRPHALVSAENKQQITLRLDSEILSFFKDTYSITLSALSRID